MADRAFQALGEGDFPPGPPPPQPAVDPSQADAKDARPERSSPRPEQQAAPASNERRARRPRTQFSPRQVAVMEQQFHRERFPDQNQIEKIAEMLDLEVQKVTTWFQNRRTKAKKEDRKRQSQLQTTSKVVAPPNVTIDKFGGYRPDVSCRLQNGMASSGSAGYLTAPPSPWQGGTGMAGPLRPHITTNTSTPRIPPGFPPPPPGMFDKENDSTGLWAGTLAKLADMSEFPDRFLQQNPSTSQGPPGFLPPRLPRGLPLDDGNFPSGLMQQQQQNLRPNRVPLQDISIQYGQVPPRQGMFPVRLESTPQQRFSTYQSRRGENPPTNMLGAECPQSSQENVLPRTQGGLPNNPDRPSCMFESRHTMPNSMVATSPPLMPTRNAPNAQNQPGLHHLPGTSRNVNSTYIPPTSNRDCFIPTNTNRSEQYHVASQEASKSTTSATALNHHNPTDLQSEAPMDLLTSSASGDTQGLNASANQLAVDSVLTCLSVDEVEDVFKNI